MNSLFGSLNSEFVLPALGQKLRVLHLRHHKFLLPDEKRADPMDLCFEEVSLLLMRPLVFCVFGDFLLQS